MDELTQPLFMCTQDVQSKYDGEFYCQKDGAAMGSPLVPLFANVFVENLRNLITAIDRTV